MRMDLPRLRVLRLLEEAIERREMAALRRESPYVANEGVRKEFRNWAARHPETNTSAALAHLCGMDPSHVRRMLGIAPTSAVTRAGKTYGSVFTVMILHPGRILTTIHRDKAAKLAQAMGVAPATIDGL